ncbi:MAG: hypothetical protein V3T83_15710 [Acidobacteriota bacterium]
MTKVDQFESVFMAAAKTTFHIQPLCIGKILVVTDLDREAGESFGRQVQGFLGALQDDTPRWQTVTGADFGNVQQLLDLVARESPGLICSYRNLESPSWRWPYSLGEYLDVLTQVSGEPVLLLPHPRQSVAQLPQGTRSVLAVTDHLTGDDRLVNHAVHFTDPEGILYLSHIEDGAVFERYLEVISKIPTIDTENAREAIGQQLLKEPQDYIDSCRAALHESGLTLQIESSVRMGHRISDYKRLIQEHSIDLLVLNTKDEDQLAMHGLAYPLAVELRHVPMLML